MNAHEIEIVRVNEQPDGFGIAIDGKIYSHGSLYYEAKATKEWLEMLPETIESILQKMEAIK